MPLGTIIATPESPSVNEFSFVVSEPVHVGEFIAVQTEKGTVIATVVNIYKSNKYFESAGAVQEYNKSGGMLTAFPVEEWEYTIAVAKPLAIYSNNRLEQVSFPPSPGNEVESVNPDLLNKFLGFDQEKGVHLGEVLQHNLPAKFNLGKLIRKHLAILAISGAGKSYATAVLIEELLSRPKEYGRVAVIVIDNHGEYVSFGEDPNFKEKVKIINAKDIRINAAKVNEQWFASLLPDLSGVQVRELGKVIKQLKERGEPYGISELISAVEEAKMSSSTKDALISWLKVLEDMRLFSSSDFPNTEELLEPGKLIVINLREILSLRKKQLIVNYLSRQLFNLRRAGKCPPYLEIIEEAHNFCPSSRAELALSRDIIETLAREGRKFGACLCLISQRPVRLSTTALSQCNTQMILRITNPNDLRHISESAEAITGPVLGRISSLKVGEALVIGEAVNYPVFIRIRQRKSLEKHSETLEEVARKYEEGLSNLANGSDFL